MSGGCLVEDLGRVRGEREGGERQAHLSLESVLMRKKGKDLKKKKKKKSEMLVDSTGRLS